MNSFFNWALSRGYVEATPTANVKPPSQEKSRDRILADEEIRLFLQATIKLGWPFGHLFQLLLLTGQRRDEVASMRWSELDLASQTPLWTLERARTKNGKVHLLPIASTTRSILLSAHQMTGSHDFVFTTNGKNAVSGFSKAKRNLDILMEELADTGMSSWTLHDLRRTAASLMARIGQPVHVVEAVLNHKSGKISGVAAVYNRYEYRNEKQQALEALDSFLGQLGSPLHLPEQDLSTEQPSREPQLYPSITMM